MNFQEGEALLVRFDRVSLNMTQQDMENAVNEQLPPDFHVCDLHLTTGGAVATLVTPWLRLNVMLRVIPQHHEATGNSAEATGNSAEAAEMAETAETASPSAQPASVSQSGQGMEAEWSPKRPGRKSFLEHHSFPGRDGSSRETLVRDGVALIEVRASRWIPIPRPMLANLLERFIGDVSPALRVTGTCLRADIRGLLEPLFKVQDVDMILEDGMLRLEGTGVIVDATPAAPACSRNGTV